MTGFRGSRQYTEGPSAWEMSSAFVETKWYDRWWPSELKPLLRPLGLDDHKVSRDDNRGIIVAPESEVHERADYILKHLEGMLSLQQTEAWRKGPPPFLSRFVREFYKENGGEIAWIVFESGRDPIGQRHKGYKELLLPSTKPEFTLKAKEIERSTKTVALFDGLKLSTRGLELVLPKGLSTGDAYLTCMAVERTLAVESSRNLLRGDWLSWCLASPDGDREILTRGSAPASGQHLLAGSINPAKMIVFTKLNYMYSRTWSYTFDLHPESGSIFSIRRASLSLQMQIALDPWLDDWLLSALQSF